MMEPQFWSGLAAGIGICVVLLFFVWLIRNQISQHKAERRERLGGKLEADFRCLLAWQRWDFSHGQIGDGALLRRASDQFGAVFVMLTSPNRDFKAIEALAGTVQAMFKNTDEWSAPILAKSTELTARATAIFTRLLKPAQPAANTADEETMQLVQALLEQLLKPEPAMSAVESALDRLEAKLATLAPADG
jgi:hypothetical protein